MSRRHTAVHTSSSNSVYALWAHIELTLTAVPNSIVIDGFVLLARITVVSVVVVAAGCFLSRFVGLRVALLSSA